MVLSRLIVLQLRQWRTSVECCSRAVQLFNPEIKLGMSILIFADGEEYLKYKKQTFRLGRDNVSLYQLVRYLTKKRKAVNRIFLY